MDHDALRLVGEFARAFEASLDPRLWITLIKEEIAETKEAHQIWLNATQMPGVPCPQKADLLKEFADVIYVSAGFINLTEGRDELYQFLLSPEEWADWELTVIDAVNTSKLGIGIFGTDTLRDAFVRVHLSNMSKLGEDGKPVRRKDGKILKGPNYEPPNLLDLV